MQGRSIHILVLVSLLMQGAFGSVGPVAALCIKTHIANSDDGHDTAAPACHVQHGCCQHGSAGGAGRPDAGATERRAAIALAMPCEDGCLDCVDVLFPDETLGFGPRMVDLVEVESIAMVAVLADRPSLLVFTAAGLPMTTGPPGVAGCPHREIVRTTRLLI